MNRLIQTIKTQTWKKIKMTIQQTSREREFLSKRLKVKRTEMKTISTPND